MSTRDAANRMSSASNLRQLCIAMNSFANDNENYFPPAAITNDEGQPLLSWRVLLLPYIEQDQLYEQFKLDEPWDSPHNHELLTKMPSAYAMPGLPREVHLNGLTVYQAIVGEGTIIAPTQLTSRPEVGVADGTDATILLVEAAEPVPWTKPADIEYDPNGPLPRLGRQVRRTLLDIRDPMFGFNASFADGSTRWIRFYKDAEKSMGLDEKVMRALITYNDGMRVPEF